MFCPQCKSEYRTGYTRCSDCDTVLVETLPTGRPASREKFRLSKRTSRVLWTFGALAAGLTLILGSYRYRHRAVYEAGYVSIGGIDQWIQIRGADRTNPVLLWVHGGPGASTIPDSASYGEWEKHFTVVMWDQRGAGKTDEKYGRSIEASMSIPRFVADGIETALYLREHLHKDKIILMGHSWGSLIGVHMAAEHPELFSAYVGTGQFTDVKRAMLSSYPRLLQRAEDNKRLQTLRGLQAIGPPPYDNPETYFVLVGVANVLDPPVVPLDEPPLEELAAKSRLDAAEGAGWVQAAMLRAVMDEDLPAVATSFQIPMIFIMGSEDLVTPDARGYFESIRAPSKEFVALPGTGHFAVFRAPDRMLEQLLDRLGH